MVIGKAAKRLSTQNIVLNTTDYVIQQCSKVKILGIYFTAGLCHIATVKQTWARNLDQQLNFTNFLDFPFKFVYCDLTKFYRNRFSIR